MMVLRTNWGMKWVKKKRCYHCWITWNFERTLNGLLHAPSPTAGLRRKQNLRLSFTGVNFAPVFLGCKRLIHLGMWRDPIGMIITIILNHSQGELRSRNDSSVFLIKPRPPILMLSVVYCKFFSESS